MAEDAVGPIAAFKEFSVVLVMKHLSEVLVS